jgi:hypothetical protein
MGLKSRSILVVVFAMTAAMATTASAFASGKPVVETKPATSIYAYTTTLNGAVNPNGAATKYYFAYFEKASQIKKTAEVSAGSGTASLEEALSATELNPEATYHFAIVATNSNGKSEGAFLTFKTPAKNLPEFGLAGTASFPDKFEGSPPGSWVFRPEGDELSWGYGHAKIAGEVSGPKTLSNVTLTFTYPTTDGLSACLSVDEGEKKELVISGLKATLGYIQKGEKPVVGLAFESTAPVKEGSRLWAGCPAGGTGIVGGKLVAALTPLDKPATTIEPRLFASGGIQEYTHLEGETAERLKSPGLSSESLSVSYLDGKFELKTAGELEIKG